MAPRSKRRGRNVHGILLLDKPTGLTSNEALQRVKRLFGARKAGHTGNLDRMATGLLPICLGEATKMSSFLLDADKAYQGVCKLGVTTGTADAEGEVLETRPVEGVTPERVREVLEGFLGEIEQVPPMHSAIKHQGQPLYKLAHQGIEVERKARRVRIDEIRMDRLEGDELEVFVHCSKGTYIRTLAEEIGEALGCGAHLSALRRTLVGPFAIDDAVTLDRLQELAQGEDAFAALDAALQPVEAGVTQWPQVALTDNASYYVRQGQPVFVPQAPTAGWVRLVDDAGRFLGMGRILDDGRVAPKRLVHL